MDRKGRGGGGEEVRRKAKRSVKKNALSIMKQKVKKERRKLRRRWRVEK